MEQQFLFIVMAIASRLYKWTTMSRLSTQSWEDGWTWFTRKFRVSQRNIFRTLAEDTWRLLFSNRSKLNCWNRGLTWEVRFRFKVEKFERRMNSNFEKQNQILILGQNAWPGLTVTDVSFPGLLAICIEPCNYFVPNNQHHSIPAFQRLNEVFLSIANDPLFLRKSDHNRLECISRFKMLSRKTTKITYNLFLRKNLEVTE